MALGIRALAPLDADEWLPRGTTRATIRERYLDNEMVIAVAAIVDEPVEAKSRARCIALAICGNAWLHAWSVQFERSDS